jgi:hypothetical protein
MTDNMLLLLRRAGFGPTAAELAAAKERGYQASIEHRVAPSGPDLGAGRAPFPSLPVDPYTRFTRPPTAREAAAADVVREESIMRATWWWLDRMTIADQQGRKKLAFFWHGHWRLQRRRSGMPGFFGNSTNYCVMKILSRWPEVWCKTPR